MGMRVAFDLLDEAGHYHGDGRQDIWLYPNGTVHCTFTMQIIDRLGHGPIQDAYVELVDDARYKRLHIGPETLSGYGATDRPFVRTCQSAPSCSKTILKRPPFSGSATRDMFGTSVPTTASSPLLRLALAHGHAAVGAGEVWVGPAAACTPASKHRCGKKAQRCACAGYAMPA